MSVWSLFIVAGVITGADAPQPQPLIKAIKAYSSLESCASAGESIYFPAKNVGSALNVSYFCINTINWSANGEKSHVRITVPAYGK